MSVHLKIGLSRCPPSHLLLLLLLRTHTITTLVRASLLLQFFHHSFSVHPFLAFSLLPPTSSSQPAFRPHPSASTTPSACETCSLFPCHLPTFLDTFLRVGISLPNKLGREVVANITRSKKGAPSIASQLQSAQSMPSPAFFHLPQSLPSTTRDLAVFGTGTRLSLTHLRNVNPLDSTLSSTCR